MYYDDKFSCDVVIKVVDLCQDFLLCIILLLYFNMGDMFHIELTRFS